MDRKALATQLKNNQLLWETFTAFATDINEAWALEVDRDKRDSLWHLQRALGEIREKLDAVIAEHGSSSSNS